jgi:hypothetical protein
MTYSIERILSLYADGHPIKEIAAEMGIAPSTVHIKIAEADPQAKKDAKEARQDVRASKYRRAGALAIDLQLRTLEHCHHLLDIEQDLLKQRHQIEQEIIAKDYEAISKDTENKLESRVKAKMILLKRDHICELIDEAAIIRGKFKDFSSVGDIAERRADLMEGNPTEHTKHDFSGPLFIMEYPKQDVDSDVQNEADTEAGSSDPAS